MARRLIVDTGILIAIEHGQLSSTDTFNLDDDVVMAAVTAAELVHGAELATGDRRQQRQEFVESVLDLVPVINYDLAVARTHGQLLAHTQRVGRKRGAHDLMIAATAAVSHRVLLTTDDRASFDDLPGVQCSILKTSTAKK